MWVSMHGATSKWTSPGKTSPVKVQAKTRQAARSLDRNTARHGRHAKSAQETQALGYLEMYKWFKPFLSLDQLYFGLIWFMYSGIL